MIVNRIINDILDWLRRVLYFKKTRKNKKQAYKIIEVYTTNHGILRYVDRDTPRAVLTYIYTPKPDTKSLVKAKSVMDYHICLDHLWALDNAEPYKVVVVKGTGNRKLPYRVYNYKADNLYTHSITIVEASRYLDKEGNYKTSVIFYKLYDFLGKSTTNYRDFFAIPIVKDIINILKARPLNLIDIVWEIEMSQKKIMGTSYLPEKKKEKEI
jgi:hypothetical protein